MISALQRRLSDLGLETELQDYLRKRITALDARNATEWGKAREENERQMNDDYSDRQLAKGDKQKPQNIFDISNERTGTVSGAIGFIAARLCKELFGTKPYVSISPRGVLDQGLADQMQKHFPWKLEQAGYEARMSEAVRVALEIDDCPFKTTWTRNEERWEEIKNVLVVKANGEPVMTPPGPDGDGTFITEDFELADFAIVNGVLSPVDPEAATTDGQPLETVQRFAAWPEFEFDPAVHEWQPHLVPRIDVQYTGLDFKICDWRDVLYDVTEFPLQNVYHRVNVPLSSLYETYAPEDDEQQEEQASPASDLTLPAEERMEGEEPSAPKPKNDILAKLEMLRNAPAADTEASKGNQSRGEQADATKPQTCSHVDVTECYFVWHWWDAKAKRQQATRVFALYHEKSGALLYYEYLAAVCPRGQLPIQIIRALPVPGRSYGIGYRTMFKRPERLLDYLTNCALVNAEMSANPIRGVNKKAMRSNNKNIVFGFGAEFELEGELQLSDMVQFLNPPTFSKEFLEMGNRVEQRVQTHTGYNDAAQANLTALPSGQTATGVNSMLEVSSVLVFHNLFWLKESSEPQLAYAAELTYSKQDEDETYEFSEGKGRALLELKTAQQISKLQLNVSLTLARSKQQSEKESAEQAIKILPTFFQLPPNVQLYLRPLYVQYANGAGINNPENMFPPPQLIEGQIVAQQQAAQAAAAGALPPGAEPPAGGPPGEAPNVVEDQPVIEPPPAAVAA